MVHVATEVDYATMEKGDALSIAHCEAVLGIDRHANQQGYSLALMGLVGQVQRELDGAGKRYTVASRRGQVVVLTDPEASEYNDHGFESGLRKSRRSHFRMQQVDVKNLADHERRHHDRQLVKQAAILQATRDARARLRPVLATRSTPILG